MTAEDEGSSVVKRERTIDLKNPMKQCTSIKALKRKRQEGSSDSSSSSSSDEDAVVDTFKSKR